MSKKYERFWPMNQVIGCENGVEKTREVFRCTECGSDSLPEKGHSGEPNTHRCSEKCQCSLSEWSSSGKTDKYNENFDRIFPDAPGAGL